MADYFIQGKKGAGKSITAVGRIRDYLERGFPVATNLDLNLECLLPPHNKTARVTRIPDQPRIEDLEALGYANYSPDESLNGLIVFDECMTWFNARQWNDKARKGINEWLIHSRKRGWDVYYLIQDHKAIDSQAREGMMEHLVTCRRTDRMNIPGVGFMFKLVTGHKLPIPKAHVARVEYADTGMVVDRWMVKAKELYSAYDTKQIFSPFYIAPIEESGVNGNYMLLPPYYTHGYKMLIKNKEFYMRLSRLYFKKLKSQIYFGSGLVAGVLCLGIALTLQTSAQAVDQVPIKNVRVSPGVVRNLTIVSQSNYNSKKTSISKTMISDGTANYYIEDLKAEGFKISYISECKIIAEKDQVKYIAQCGLAKDDMPGEARPVTPAFDIFG